MVTERPLRFKYVFFKVRSHRPTAMILSIGESLLQGHLASGEEIYLALFLNGRPPKEHEWPHRLAIKYSWAELCFPMEVLTEAVKDTSIDIPLQQYY